MSNLWKAFVSATEQKNQLDIGNVNTQDVVILTNGTSLSIPTGDYTGWVWIANGQITGKAPDGARINQTIF